MLASQRALFDMPRDICYLNSASYSPLPLQTQEAGRAAVGRKGRPWTLEPDFANGQHERARTAAARLIKADAADVALISSISYGVATAAKVLTIARGARVLVLENDHSSPVLEWQTRADAQGFVVETVQRPDDGDWTSAVLAAIERSGAPPVGLASISSVHWSDGGLIDIEKVGAALRRQGAAFLIDATHGAGVLAMDVRNARSGFRDLPDLQMAARPLRQGVSLRREAPSGRHPAGADLVRPPRRPLRERGLFRGPPLRCRCAALRHGRARPFHLDGDGLDRHGDDGRLGRGGRRAALQMLTERIAEGVRDPGVSVPERRVRAPHILSLGFQDGMPAGLIEGLATEGIYVAPRLGRMRISPHVFNDEADADRFIAALARRLRG